MTSKWRFESGDDITVWDGTFSVLDTDEDAEEYVLFHYECPDIEDPYRLSKSTVDADGELVEGVVLQQFVLTEDELAVVNGDTDV